jgi:hypothetical protein
VLAVERAGRGDVLLKEALDLIRFGPLFPTTDPSVPRFSIEQVDQAERRMRQDITP